MGLDYIRAQTGMPWRKRWNSGLDRLKSPTLLDLTMTENSRSLAVELSPNASPKPGDTLIVESGKDGLIVSDGLRPIGRITQTPADIATAIVNSGGYAEAIVQRISVFGDTAEISVR